VNVRLPLKTETMEKPNRDNKKYHYYHKKAGKKMFNQELFSADFKKYNEYIKDKNINQ
jgi:hypothetical protein